MHARELVELAGIVVSQAPALLASPRPVLISAVEQYWTSSKCRLDRWTRVLKTYATTSHFDRAHAARQWTQVRPALEEILTGEILTRTWTAVLCAMDQRHGHDEAGPMARSVLLGHLEARRRALSLLVHGPGVDTREAVSLNRLRRSTERWSDLLLGALPGSVALPEFCVDSERARDFAEDLADQRAQPGGHIGWPLMLSSLRAAFQAGLTPVGPNADLNSQIGAAVAGCFPPEVFDSTGLCRSLWLMRLTRTATDAQGLIADLLHTPHPLADGARPEPQITRHRFSR